MQFFTGSNTSLNSGASTPYGTGWATDESEDLDGWWSPARSSILKRFSFEEERETEGFHEPLPPPSGMLHRIARSPYSKILNNPCAFIVLAVGVTLISVSLASSPDSNLASKAIEGGTLVLLTLFAIGGCAINYGERQIVRWQTQRIRELEDFQQNSEVSFRLGFTREQYLHKKKGWEQNLEALITQQGPTRIDKVRVSTYDDLDEVIPLEEASQSGGHTTD